MTVFIIFDRNAESHVHNKTQKDYFKAIAKSFQLSKPYSDLLKDKPPMKAGDTLLAVDPDNDTIKYGTKILDNNSREFKILNVIAQQQKGMLLCKYQTVIDWKLIEEHYEINTESEASVYLNLTVETQGDGEWKPVSLEPTEKEQSRKLRPQMPDAVDQLRTVSSDQSISKPSAKHAVGSQDGEWQYASLEPTEKEQSRKLRPQMPDIMDQASIALDIKPPSRPGAKHAVGSQKGKPSDEEAIKDNSAPQQSKAVVEDRNRLAQPGDKHAVGSQQEKPSDEEAIKDNSAPQQSKAVVEDRNRLAQPSATKISVLSGMLLAFATAATGLIFLKLGLSTAVLLSAAESLVGISIMAGFAAMPVAAQIAALAGIAFVVGAALTAAGIGLYRTVQRRRHAQRNRQAADKLTSILAAMAKLQAENENLKSALSQIKIKKDAAASATSKAQDQTELRSKSNDQQEKITTQQQEIAQLHEKNATQEQKIAQLKEQLAQAQRQPSSSYQITSQALGGTPAPKMSHEQPATVSPSAPDAPPLKTINPTTEAEASPKPKGSLLDQIRQGTELKKTPEKLTQKEEIQSTNQPAEQTGIMAILQNKMENIRTVAASDSECDDDDDYYDDDDWLDDTPKPQSTR